jgi:hypothetical protein
VAGVDSFPRPAPPAPPKPPELGSRASENLAFIRETMERASSFTAVPGWGGVGMGVSALVAAFLASRAATPETWLGIWLVEAFVGFSIGAAAMARKARRAGTTLFSGPAKRFLLTLSPPLAAGAVLTLVLERAHQTALLPGVWLLLYGAAVVTGGAFAVRVVPAMGVLLMMLGVVALASPAAWGDAFLAAGLGGLQIGFGLAIGRRHGG